ncbi:RNA-binding protein 41 [Genypterus blacodes]|uniref:RNA-binding protein 41 n=1 Tax=Genypterus blacodes TaxID=154954 RepID=UPI003F761C52
MRRVSQRPCEEGPLLEEQETEGQRQLHSLLLQQLHTDVDIQRCVAKKQCFAPAALYKPFGEQAAGVRSLSQFQALQDGERELASLRELGLTDTEILLWQSRDTEEKSQGVCAAPAAKQQRLQVIRDKIEARAELLSRPQRFATSRPLSRREMEIEQALFQGSNRLGFLAALYHRDEDNPDGQQGAASSDPMDSLYRDVLCKGRAASLQDAREETSLPSHPSVSHQSENNQSQTTEKHKDQSQDAGDRQTELPGDKQDSPAQTHPAAPKRISMSQPISSLCAAATVKSNGPLTVRGEIETISDEEIEKNRESEEGIKSITRFRNYQPGKASKVLCVKNLSAQASVAKLVALFSRFERESGPAVVYRLLTGRLKGQAFITLPDVETAQTALHLVHGYRLLGKPLVVEFGRERTEEEEEEKRK